MNFLSYFYISFHIFHRTYLVCAFFLKCCNLEHIFVSITRVLTCIVSFLNCLQDPTFARDNGLIVDRLFYIDHQLRNPIISLFDPLVDDPEEEIFGHETIKPKIDQLRNIFKSDLKIVKRVKKNVANKQHEITSFFTKKPKLEA